MPNHHLLPPRLHIWLLAALLLASPFASAQAPAPAPDPALQKVRQLLAIPEEQLDLGKTKLAIDQL